MKPDVYYTSSKPNTKTRAMFHSTFGRSRVLYILLFSDHRGLEQGKLCGSETRSHLEESVLFCCLKGLFFEDCLERKAVPGLTSLFPSVPIFVLNVSS